MKIKKIKRTEFNYSTKVLEETVLDYLENISNKFNAPIKDGKVTVVRGQYKIVYEEAI